MKKVFFKTGNLYWVIACLLLVATGCQKNIEKTATSTTDANTQSAASDARRLKVDFQQVNIVSDTAEFNPIRIDANLVNAWGLAFASSPIGPPWVNANGTGLSNIFNVSTGADLIPPVAIPSPGNPMGGGTPTGIVFNKSGGFKLPNGNPARFIFVGEDGIISGWNGGPVAIQAKDNSATAIYKGIAIAADGADSFIYAANFKAKRIDVYDANWTQVNNKPFHDPSVPSDYGPFNIQNINNNLFVMYAKTVPGSTDEQDGPSLGFVSIFRSNGTLLASFAKRGVLNAPWGCAMAPASWANKKWDGDESDDDNSSDDKKQHFDNVKAVILIGNFGDGRINAFNQDGQFLGRLRSNKKAIVIDGLWALSFAPATATAINPDWLFFTAGPGDEDHGLFGYLQGQ